MWYAWALGSTLFWGLFYLFLGRLSSTLSPLSLYWLPNAALFLLIPFTYKQLITDYTTLWNADLDTKIIAAITSCLSVIASFMYFKAIGMHNATHASLIQITYPIFIAIFGYLIFKQNDFNWSVVLGGLMIMAGAGIIIYNNG